MTFASVDKVSRGPIIIILVYISCLRHPLFDYLLNTTAHVVYDEFRERQSDVLDGQLYRRIKHSSVSIYMNSISIILFLYL